MMDQQDEALIQALLPNDAELQQFYEEHVVLERQLAELNRKLYLSTQLELEKKQLQKRKLAGKDRIMEILARHRSGAAASAS